MNLSSFRLLAVTGAALLAVTPAAGQQPSPEQRLERLERQLQQVQRQVFPRGAPAATAGLSDEPAATQSSVRNIDARLTAIERQLADILRQSEENGHRAAVVEAELARLRTEQERRLSALESAAAAPVATVQPPAAVAPAPTQRVAASSPNPAIAQPSVAAAEDPAEIAYDEGYQLWRTGKYDEALTSLRAFSSAYPRHRRTSWANNLAGRALLDKGQPRAAAEALLANYRADPSGERAADSLFYLGQSLMKLGQPEQACKAYAELEDVYGAKMRDELKRLLPPAKSDAGCS